MDAGDYIYIIIAIVLGIINAVANKKKKDAAKRKAAETELETETQIKDPAELLQDILLGKTETFEPEQQSYEPQTNWTNSNNESRVVEEENQIADTEKHKPYWSYETKEDYTQSIEYEQPFEEVKEEKLYPTLENSLIDIPDNAKFTPVDIYNPIKDSIVEFNYETISVTEEEGEEMPDMIFDHENAMAMEESAMNVADEFDPKKAIIYSEIMRPKYI